MSIHQIHFEKKFYQDKKTGYWISTTSPRIRAHVWVWKYHHTSIPKGWHVHHKDGNKSNNCLSNLTILNVSDHVKHHMQDPIRKQKILDMANKYRYLTKQWHASEEGLAWHKAHGILCWIKKELITISCKECGKESETKVYHQEFCSNACKSKNRRKSGIDNIEKTCTGCFKLFSVNKYSNQKYCSRSCAKKLNK